MRRDNRGRRGSSSKSRARAAPAREKGIGRRRAIGKHISIVHTIFCPVTVSEAPTAIAYRIRVLIQGALFRKLVFFTNMENCIFIVIMALTKLMASSVTFTTEIKVA